MEQDGVRRGLAGFPAHAGMDPRCWITTSRCGRFPRPRGDGPLKKRFEDAREEVSPPTRGWTWYAWTRESEPVGFPAHAGMDPQEPSLGSTARRFPRPRGDGPYVSGATLAASEVSPPTRGWTVKLLHCGIAPNGFPAHAGMDPEQAATEDPAAGFPRPRGDGPGVLGRGTRFVKVSPPTRGWTCQSVHVRRARLGFPAHAGMDLISER